MEKVTCLNCKKEIKVNEIKKGINVLCECGCQMKCLDVNDFISRWRVVNPFNFKDLRKKK